MIKAAIQAKIWSAPNLANKFARWDFGDGALRPAVFVRDPAPLEAKNPVGVIQQLGGVSNFETRGQRGFEALCTLRIWGDRTGSERALDAMAWDAWALFHRAQLSLDGYEYGYVEASVPEDITDNDGFPGRLLNLNVKAMEQL